MKISKDKLKQIVREELESLTVLSERKIKGKAVGNFLKKGRAGRTLTMQGKKYTDLGKGKWKGPDNKKLDWIELSSMASALGDEMVTLDEKKISENKNKFFIVDPTGMRGEPAYYRRKSTNDDSAFEFSTLFGATGFDDKGSANTTLKRIKSSSSKYKRATLKVLRGDELHEEISEATDNAKIQKQIDQAEKYLSRIHGNSSSVKKKKFAIQTKIDKLKKQLQESDVEENNALANAIANRDANRANRDVEERFEDLYFGLQKLISKVSKNNKVKGYGGELTHAFVDLLYAVETDRLGVGEIFNGLKKINSKISKK